jgi:hypothetical protein
MKVIRGTFLAALPEMQRIRWTYFHERAQLFPQVIALPTARTSASPRLAAAVLCRAAVWRPLVVVTAAENGSVDHKKQLFRCLAALLNTALP